MTAVAESFSGEHTGELIPHPLVLTEQIANLPCADADVTGRDVGVWTDVSGKLGHQALAEAHDLGVRTSLGVKVTSALAAAHRQTGQAVFEGLLKCEELDDRQVDAGMQPQTALVRTDGRVKLHSPGAVDLGFAMVVLPGNTELDGSLRLDHPLQQTGSFIFRVAQDDRLQSAQHLGDGI